MTTTSKRKATRGHACFRSIGLLRIGLLGLTQLLVFSRCTFAVRPSPAPYYAPARKHDMTAGLVISKSWRYIHYSHNSCTTGILYTWQVATGDALAHGAETVFRSMFAEIVWLESETDTAGKNVDLLVCPELIAFSISGDLAASASVRCKLVDRTGHVLYSKTTFGSGASEYMGVAVLGALAVEPALRRTTEDAMCSALLAQAGQIENQIDLSGNGGR